MTKKSNIDKFLKLVSDEKSNWVEDLEHYNENKERLDKEFDEELAELVRIQNTI